MIEVIVLGILLFLILCALVVATIVLRSRLVAIERGLSKAKKSLDRQVEVLEQMGSSLSELSRQINSLGVLLTAAHESARDRDAREQRQHAEQLKSTEELAKEAAEMAKHTATMKTLVTGLGRIAKAQIASTIAVEKAARIFTQRSFGVAGSDPAFTLEEEHAIKDMMSGEGVSRKDAEVAIVERRSDNILEDFFIDKD